MAADVPGEAVARAPRLAAIDVARGVAIVAMVIYHTGFDLSANGLIATDVLSDVRWRLLARLTAGSFLLLVGISLVLSTRSGLNLPTYLRRLAFVAGGALLVTAATWWFDRSTYVFFGILHEIAVASVLALPFLRLPSWPVALAAAAVIAAPWSLANPMFDQPWLWWLGLSPVPPISVDFVPIFPWFGLVLAGIVAGRGVVRFEAVLSRWRPTDIVSRVLMLASRWSLPIYLIHQPLIVGALSLWAMMFPPGEAFLRDRFVGQCTAACVGDRSEQECTALCGCLFDGMYGTDLYTMHSTEDMTPDQQSRWDTLVGSCRAEGGGD